MKTIIIVLLNFIIGTVCLMTGVNFMSKGLENANQGLMKRIVSKFTGSLPLAFLTGTVTTALVQSSTAITVITVGFVNSGLIKLSQAVGIIYGANIGTTVTAQLMSLNLTGTAFPILILGFIIRLLSKKPSIRSVALAFMGFGLMFVGIGVLNSGVPYIKESEIVYNLFKDNGSRPLIGMLIGMLTTMLVHSSSATVGLTIVLFNSGLISLDGALGLTLGDNIGTCITAQLASIGTNISARRTAWAHTLYNVIGVLIALLLFNFFRGAVKYVTFSIGHDKTRLIANAHTIFNILSAAVFLPITKYYVRFIEWVINE